MMIYCSVYPYYKNNCLPFPCCISIWTNKLIYDTLKCVLNPSAEHWANNSSTPCAERTSPYSLGMMHPYSSRPVWWVTFFDLCLNTFCYVLFICDGLITNYNDLNILIFSFFSSLQNPNEGSTTDIPVGIICYDDNRAANIESPQLNPSRLGIVLEWNE